MTPFIQRLEDAQFDGLNSADYPVDTLIDVRDSVDPDDPYTAAPSRALLFSVLRGLRCRPQNRTRGTAKG